MLYDFISTRSFSYARKAFSIFLMALKSLDSKSIKLRLVLAIISLAFYYYATSHYPEYYLRYSEYIQSYLLVIIITVSIGVVVVNFYLYHHDIALYNIFKILINIILFKILVLIIINFLPLFFGGLGLENPVFFGFLMFVLAPDYMDIYQDTTFLCNPSSNDNFVGSGFSTGQNMGGDPGNQGPGGPSDMSWIGQSNTSNSEDLGTNQDLPFNNVSSNVLGRGIHIEYGTLQRGSLFDTVKAHLRDPRSNTFRITPGVPLFSYPYQFPDILGPGSSVIRPRTTVPVRYLADVDKFEVPVGFYDGRIATQAKTHFIHWIRSKNLPGNLQIGKVIDTLNDKEWPLIREVIRVSVLMEVLTNPDSRDVYLNWSFLDRQSTIRINQLHLIEPIIAKYVHLHFYLQKTEFSTLESCSSYNFFSHKTERIVANSGGSHTTNFGGNFANKQAELAHRDFKSITYQLIHNDRFLSQEMRDQIDRYSRRGILFELKKQNLFPFRRYIDPSIKD